MSIINYVKFRDHLCPLRRDLMRHRIQTVPSVYQFVPHNQTMNQRVANGWSLKFVRYGLVSLNFFKKLTRLIAQDIYICIFCISQDESFKPYLSNFRHSCGSLAVCLGGKFSFSL
jgi:hypothetical protein